MYAVGWRSSVLIVILAFGVLFSAFSISELSMPRHPPNSIPTSPKISQLQVIETVEQHLRGEIPNLQETRLYFSLYNFSYQRWEHDPEYERYISTVARGGWSFSDIKEHPELLQLPLYFVHANATQYAVNATDDTFQLQCLQAPDIAHCAFPAFAANAAKDRLVYRVESTWFPSAIVKTSISVPFGYHVIDAETGELVWNSIDWERDRMRAPRVDIYDNVSNARTIREQIEAKLNPPETVEVQIVEGASNAEQEKNFVPQEARGVMEISNKVRWINYDAIGHTVSSDNNYSNEFGDRFDSGLIEPSSSYEYLFSEVGEYPYHCDIHPWMRGEIIIVENFA